TFSGSWWIGTRHHARPPVASAPAAWMDARAAAPAKDAAEKSAPPESAEAPPPEAPQELGSGEEKERETEQKTEGPPEAMGIEASETDTALGKIPENFYAWFWAFAALCALVLGIYYWRMDGEQLEIRKLLEEAVVPLGVLTFIVLAVILFGITTASESAGVGALGAVYLAALAKYPRRAMWSSLPGAIIGVAMGMIQGDPVTLIVAGSLGAAFAGRFVPFALELLSGGQRPLAGLLKESTFLTAKTTAMVCWLFVGSALFSAVFALHGGQQLIEKWVLSLDLSPVQFMI